MVEEVGEGVMEEAETGLSHPFTSAVTCFFSHLEFTPPPSRTIADGWGGGGLWEVPW